MLTRVLGGVLTAGLLLAALDVAQVALVAPGSLGLPSLVVLTVLYVALVAPAVVAVWAAGRDALAPVVGAGVGLFALERVLRTDEARIVLGLAVGLAAGLAGWGLLRVVARRVGPRALALAALVVWGTALNAARPGPAAPLPHRAAPERGSGPNVLLVTIDTLRADHLSSYGYERQTSPELDAIAAQGMRFRRAFAQAASTKPSTASLLTGTYPSTHRAVVRRERLGERAVLLAERLQAAGWATATVSGNPWITPAFGFAQGSEHFHAAYDENVVRFPLLMTGLWRASSAVDRERRVYAVVKRLVLGATHGSDSSRRDEGLIDAASRWLAQPRARPFFLYLHLMSPHHPYDPPPPYDRFVARPPHAPVRNYPAKSYYFDETGAPLGAAAQGEMVARYDGEIRWVDALLGRFLGGLRDHGVLDDTVLVITADHGEEFYDHHNWGHGQSLYNELTHVPLILRYPPRVPAGVVIGTPVMLVDVVPTVLALVGLPDDDLPGRDLLAVAAYDPASDRPGAYAEIVYLNRWGRALVQGEAKIIETEVNGQRRLRAYDLRTDFEERHDLLANEPVAPEIRQAAEALRATAAAVQARAAAGRLDRDETAVDGDLDRHLRALGYTE